MKKVALLIDGGWFCKGLGKVLARANGWPTAPQVVKNAKRAVLADEEIFRIYYYDCEPFMGKVKNPVDATETDYSTTPAVSARKQFFHELGRLDFVALRRGDLKQRGWEFTQPYRKALMTGVQPVPLTGGDVYANFEQKGVDMRIGIDVATLALKRLVDRIILFSGDGDMIPAMKLARREGLQVYVAKINNWKSNSHLLEDSDGARHLDAVA